MKAIETLISKFLDFLNFGRFITVVIPGFIIAFSLSMLMSQIIYPEGQKSVDVVKTRSEQLVLTKKDGKSITEQIVKESSSSTAIVSENREPKSTGMILLSQQVSADYQRLLRNAYLIVVLIIVAGLMNYELGYMVISKLIDKNIKEKDKLHGYDMKKDEKGHPTFEFDQKKHVGLGYFSPFLKEKFSGYENYFDFIITEYYRFVEFSVVMPLSLISAGIIGIFYYILFCFRNLYSPYLAEFVYLSSIFIAINLFFVVIVTPLLIRDYIESRKDIIWGVSDFMDKTYAHMVKEQNKP